MAINPVIAGGNYWPKQAIDTRLRHLQEGSALAQGLPQPKESPDFQKACQEFESLFIYFLLKTMRKSTPTSTFLGKGPGEDMYTSLFDQELAKNIAQRGGIGISQMLIRELSSPNPINKPFAGPNETSAIPFEEEIRETAENHPTSNGEKEIEEKLNEAITKYPEYILPLSGKVTSHFGLRKDPFTDKICFHAGIDLAMAAGSEVGAAYPGKVIFCGRRDGYGNLVVLQHDDNYTTYYAHNSKNLVNEGEMVEAGQTIALVGGTGRTTGPHLHFELREGGIPIDPAKVINLET